MVVLATVFAWIGCLPAQAVIITVGGTDYDVRFFSSPAIGQPSFTTNQASLILTPWWGNATLASDFAAAFLAQANGTFSVSASNDRLNFAHAVSGGTVSVAFYGEAGFVGTSTNTANSVLGNGAYAYTVPIITPVPEIDGNALAKALFLLFTLYVWLQVRRNRRRVA